MSPRPNDWWVRVKVGAAVTLGGLLIRLLGRTWRIRHEGAERLYGPLRRGETQVVVFWHGEILPIAWGHRGSGIAPLISTHADGEIIARIVEDLGYRTVRGSTSRGGARAILEMVRLLEEGVTIAVTPDGPRGPRHDFAPGALAVAQRAGRPVLGVRASATRAWRLRSWDRHLVPKPFATVTYRYSEPQLLRAGSVREAEARAPEMAQMLLDLAPAPND
ncbi:MAG TPA: lysophospholipid acyltransferase family protein [Gemmatimonadaceae bacterium]|nr:lysophospholipid acyltransferase family protein [Gemmatimonadaceae bacterium]